MHTVTSVRHFAKAKVLFPMKHLLAYPKRQPTQCKVVFGPFSTTQLIMMKHRFVFQLQKRFETKHIPITQPSLWAGENNESWTQRRYRMLPWSQSWCAGGKPSWKRSQGSGNMWNPRGGRESSEPRLSFPDDMHVQEEGWRLMQATFTICTRIVWQTSLCISVSQSMAVLCWPGPCSVGQMDWGREAECRVF